jgi:hypothetical protein
MLVIKTLVLVIKEKEKTGAHFVGHQIILTVGFLVALRKGKN